MTPPPARARWALAAALLWAAACKHAAVVDRAPLEAVQRRPGAFVSGRVVDLSEPFILEDRDFVYALALSSDGTRAAFSVLRAPETKLVLSRLTPLVPQAAVVPVNRYEYDVEAVEFSPDGKALVTASRDGAVRAFSSETGAPLAVHATEEPLVSLAFHPAGRYVFAGSARGQVTALHFPSLSFAADARLHADEVRGLAVGPEGTLYSAGWDKQLVATPTAEAVRVADEARLPFTRQGGTSFVRATIDGRASGAFALDARAPHVLVHGELARAAGIDPAALTELVTLPTPLGSTLARVARGHELALKGLRVPGVALVVCDACLPSGAHAVLGAPFLAAVDVQLDEVAGELRLTRKVGAPRPEPGPALALQPPRRATFPGHLNDVSVDRSGRVLGLAMSQQRAERSFARREREKKGLKGPRGEHDAGLRVDAATFGVLDRWSLHEDLVSTAAVSPDGQTLATGGWDNQLLVCAAGQPREALRRRFGWILRHVRFSRDGRLLGVAAWTPPKPSHTQHSDPSALVYEVGYAGAEVRSAP